MTNYYDRSTNAFIATTRDVDMSDARGRFLAAVPSRPDGACASLLHVSEADLAGVIDRLADHLVPGGALYVSFKRGTGERVKDGRRFTDMTAESLAALLDGSGAFREPDIWESRDCRPDRASEVWVNAVVNKA